MAVIGKIRSKSGLILVTVGVAMALFVLGDLLNSGSGLLRGSNNVGEIDGEPISYRRFESMVQEQMSGQTANEQQREQVRNQVWNQLLQEKVLLAEFDKVGIDATAEEIFFQLKNNPSNPVLTRYFTNPQSGQIFEQFRAPQGGLDNQKAIAYFKNIINSDQVEQWLPLEKALKTNRMVSKYNKLIESSLYATAKDVELYHQEENRAARFAYVLKRYDDISDEEISYDEGDLRSYYNENKSKPEYQQDETTRSIKYTIFNVEPTDEDIELLENELRSLKDAFFEAANDTDFINEYSDVPMNLQLAGRSDVPRGIDTVLFNGEVDQVYGPFTMGPEMRIVKILNTKMESDSVRARHILIPINEERDTASAKQLIDSIKTVISGKNNFEEMAEKYSEDFGSANKGGDLDWFTRGKMVPPFEQACFDGEKGDVTIVLTQFGYHLIEITNKTKEKEKLVLAFVTRRIGPSENTFDNIYNKASEFSINNSNIEAFEVAVEEAPELQVSELDFIKEQDKTLGDFESPRNVIRWIYDNESGKVSEPFEQGNRFIVVSVDKIKEEGVLSFEAVKEDIELEVIKEKKAELITSNLTEYSSIEEVASMLETEVESVEGITFNEFSIPGMGRDNFLMGVIFGMQAGEISEPLEGEEGVVIIQMNEFTEPAVAPDYKIIRDQIAQSLRARIDQEVYEALKESKNVEDNRYKYY